MLTLQEGSIVLSVSLVEFEQVFVASFDKVDYIFEACVATRLNVRHFCNYFALDNLGLQVVEGLLGVLVTELVS